MDYQNWSLLWEEPLTPDEDGAKQVVARVTALKKAKVWKAGMWLPPQRKIAEKLGLAKAKVKAAIKMLEAADVVEIVPRKGTRIAGEVQLMALGLDGPPPFAYATGASSPPPPFTEKGNYLQLGCEYPQLSNLKLNTYIKGFSQCMGNIQINKLSEAACRDVCVASLLSLLANRQIHVAPDQLVLIPDGRAVELVAESLCLRGEVVLMDDGYDRMAYRAFHKAGADIHFTGTVDGVLDLDAVEHLCETRKPSCLFVRSAASAWEGRSLSVGDRLRLLTLSQRYRFTIVCLHEQFDFSVKKPYYPLLLHEGAERVIYISALSNINALTRSLAVVVGYGKFVQALVRSMGMADIHGDPAMEYAICQLVAEGLVEHELAALLRVYGNRAEAISVAFRKRLAGHAAFRLADAGFVATVALNDGLPVGDLLAEFKEMGVYDPELNVFLNPGQPVTFLRIGYAVHDATVWRKVFDAIADRMGA